MPTAVKKTVRIAVDDKTSLVGWELGEGPTVLLLHAGGERSDVWEPIADRLVDQHRVRCLAVDQRGHGASDGVADRLGAFGDDVAAILADHGEPVVLVGSSLGGLAAIEALRHANVRRLTTGLVLVDVGPDPDADLARRYLTTIGMMDRNRALIEDILRSPTSRHALLADANKPVLLARASRSVMSNADVERLDAVAADLTTVAIDAGHLIAREAPTELAAAIGLAIDRWLHY